MLKYYFLSLSLSINIYLFFKCFSEHCAHKNTEKKNPIKNAYNQINKGSELLFSVLGFLISVWLSIFLSLCFCF